jgi:hypothetical protein
MFFEMFPQFITTQGGRQFILTDVIRRSVVNQTYRTLSPFLVPYTVMDGETPDQVSQRFYGTPFYHWVILLLNEIINPFEEWPMMSGLVPKYVHRKYPFTITVPSTEPYEVGDVLVSSLGATYTVTKIRVGEIQIQHADTRTFITTTTTFTNQRTQETGLPVISVIDPEEAVHHWEDVDGNWVDASFAATPVSNVQYESDRNDQKRRVFVLEAAYIQRFVEEFERSINE